MRVGPHVTNDEADVRSLPMLIFLSEELLINELVIETHGWILTVRLLLQGRKMTCLVLAGGAPEEMRCLTLTLTRLNSHMQGYQSTASTSTPTQLFTTSMLFTEPSNECLSSFIPGSAGCIG